MKAQQDHGFGSIDRHFATDRLIGQTALALGFALVLAQFGGCLETEFYPLGVVNQADVGEVVDSGSVTDAPADVTETDAAVDVGVDTPPVDVVVDVADTGVDDIDVAETIEDVPAEIDEDVEDVEADLVVDVELDTGPLLLPLGADCTDDALCASGLCVWASTTVRSCSETCTGECPAGLRCSLAPSTGSSTLHYCLPLPGDLCEACDGDADCDGGKCIQIESTGQSLCGLDCSAIAGGAEACPAGFVCQSFLKGDHCVPTYGTCTCDEDLWGSQWPCAVSTPIGKCLGSQLCGGSGWSICTAKMPAGELCNGQDDNCNGKIDEGFGLVIAGEFVPLGGGPCGVGACSGGVVVCAADGKGATCSTAAKAAKKDLCGDKIDNDCDDEVDEDCPAQDVDGDGTPDKDDCKPYDAAAWPGAAEPCCLALAATQVAIEVEVDEKTNDCDLSCDGKVKACLIADTDGDGFSAPEDCDDKDPMAFPGAAEKCDDGKDQDCNGGDLACAAVLDSDKDGYPVGPDCNDDNGDIHPGAPELCNNKDDNCDGVIDDGNPGGWCDDSASPDQASCTANLATWFATGSACGLSAGACEPGTLVCVHLGLAASATCTDAQGGSPELCNGIDDDCDSATDEDYVDLGQPCDGDDADQCKHGLSVCAGDGLGVSCGAETKTDLLEQCSASDATVGNGKDEDCDGQTDEVCYGADVDGDGYIDDDCDNNDAGRFPGAKEPCCDPVMKNGPSEVLLDSCDYNCDGTVAYCDPADTDLDGFWGEQDCNDSDPTIHEGAAEKCDDGVDQDCDNVDLSCKGLTDDDGDSYPAGPPPTGDCNDSNPNIHPGAEEQCNLKDDDCDGVTDEGNPGAIPGACGSSDGECKPGKEVCVRQKFKATLLCAPEVGPSTELCNGQDDNCNGKTDEYNPELGQSCDGDDDDECQNGTWTCAADGSGSTCDNEIIEDRYELCDGIDNDCDGATDEGMDYFGGPLGSDCQGLGACGAGVVVCSPELQIAVCSSDAWGPASEASAEQCDGIDNDCDSLTDEGITFGGTPLGGTCYGTGACATSPGQVECAPGGNGAICSTMAGGSAFLGSKETCNGKDDDCDGHVDEALTAADSICKQTGVCTLANVKAKCLAGKWQCNYDGVVGYHPEKEYLCDAIDNDCDGQTDEEFLAGLPCDGTDTDLCANGIYGCSDDGQTGECKGETAVSIGESCNGKDDDCDGKTDEDFPIGEPCDGSDDDKCTNGTWTCAPNGSGAVCTNETSEDIVDVCNGEDDDCDGATDEDYPGLNDPCDGDDSDLCKNGVISCTGDGKATECGVEALSDIPEVCDKFDNDCDGKIDEDQLYEGLPLGLECKGVGACGDGEVICSPQTQLATCSTNPDAYLIFEGKELCDGLDNDCNGLTDDELAWKGNPLGAGCDGVGICGAGKVECGTDKQVTCSTLANGSAPQQLKESCNLKDDDCDGVTDNAMTAEDSECKHVGVCSSEALKAACVAGGWVCDYVAVPGYQVEETTCDGLDNDCDGETDEGFDIGEACDGDDKDKCKNGTWTCSADGQNGQCLNEAMTNVPEVCDGLDNDCDGDTDEGFAYSGDPLGNACDGEGQCGPGFIICGQNNDKAVCSTDPEGTESQAKAEACDGLDNDCDGETDDGLLYQNLSVGKPCSGVGECGLGTVVCAPQTQKATCSSNPDGTEPKVQTEVCDAKDNDCDGKTDEQLDPKQSSCNQQGVCSKTFKATCAAGSWQCSYDGKNYQAKETWCDGVDNDCNGVVDDPFPTAGEPCDGPDADKCKSGTLTCSPSKASLVCFEESGGGGPTAETCNGKDDDCNGKTDEKYPELGQVCDGPDGDSCANGTFTCSPDGSSVQCINEFPTNVQELCDNQDNDCDGTTDEGFPLGQACDGPDSDECKNGTWSCGKVGKLECTNETVLNIKELCNLKDDDCDGATDEGFGQKGLKCDSSADSDSCETGTYQCTPQGTLACTGDNACVSGASCKISQSSAELDQCLCGGSSICSSSQGDSCSGGVCTCKGGSACGFGQKCTASGCKPL